MTAARRSRPCDIRPEAWKSDIDIPGTGNSRHGTRAAPKQGLTGNLQNGRRHGKRRLDPGRTATVSPCGCGPRRVPIVAGGVDDAPVGLEELVRHLEDREHQPAFGAPGDMAAAFFPPDEFAGLAFDALRRAFLVDEQPSRT